MASTSQKPKKGILKHSGSIDHSKKEIEWDEMNILATYHPADKDYGFMKVDEPPTPYNRAASDNEEEVGAERKGSVSSVTGLDPEMLAKKLACKGEPSGEKHFYSDDPSDESDHENETEEEREKRKVFLLKRKAHYNEFAAVQLAKKLMAEDEDEEEDPQQASEKQKQGSAAPKGTCSSDSEEPDCVQENKNENNASQELDEQTSCSS
ncbi:protein phosphatase inhibitor 2-like isoform X2 [Physella acuta]|uniref:protein phosphatase inhibitor 2-like isoform X2 n=1 Tax=Physella acuta TaxID=109671 RepID=UPI0027DB2EB1|nr:protein phosphatase inhibitor 2-like isoform X2 [Physella acuta]